MNDPTLATVSDSGWKLLGEIELPANFNVDSINTWMIDLLLPLKMHLDFVNQLLSSVQGATLNAMNSSNINYFKHIHLSVFIPTVDVTLGNAWGFFRIEKIDDIESSENHLDHRIEFYLYQDG